MSALVISYIKAHNLRNLLLQAGDAFRMEQPRLTILMLRPTFILSLKESACMSVFKSQLAERATLFYPDIYRVWPRYDVQLCSFSSNTLSPLNDYRFVRKGLLACHKIKKGWNTYLPLISKRISSYLGGHTFLIESSQLTFIINFDELLAASSGEWDVQLKETWWKKRWLSNYCNLGVSTFG